MQVLLPLARIEIQPIEVEHEEHKEATSSLTSKKELRRSHAAEMHAEPHAERKKVLMKMKN